MVYPTLSGDAVRIHLSNEYGKAPLVVEALRIARSTGGAAQSNGGVVVTFGGKESVTVPPGGELDSDAMAFEIAAGAPYAISSYMGTEQRLVAWHRVSNQVNYVSLPGNHADDAMPGAFHQRFTQFAWVTGLSVEAPASAAVAAIGDSITDGCARHLTRITDGRTRFHVGLRRRGDRRRGRESGISGNRLLSGSPCYGDALMKRFDRDVLRGRSERDGDRADRHQRHQLPSMPAALGAGLRRSTYFRVAADLLLRVISG